MSCRHERTFTADVMVKECADCGAIVDSEIERLQAALKVAEQACIEVAAAQERGANWYTRGANGLYDVVHRWTQQALKAIAEVKDYP